MRSTVIAVGVLGVAIAVTACREHAKHERLYTEGRTVTIEGRTHWYPAAGMVPDSATAVGIAEAVLLPIYGRSHVYGARPYTAVLDDSIWTVRGFMGPNVIGGTFTVEIRRDDARIVRLAID